MLYDDNGWHQCHFCGTYVKDGYEHNGDRHYLSDCRPDLVQHEIGPDCTWYGLSNQQRNQSCYAYQDRETQEWTDDHVHFYADGAM